MYGMVKGVTSMSYLPVWMLALATPDKVQLCKCVGVGKVMCKCVGVGKVMCQCVGVWKVMCKCVGVGNVIWKVRGKYGRVAK